MQPLTCLIRIHELESAPKSSAQPRPLMALKSNSAGRRGICSDCRDLPMISAALHVSNSIANRLSRRGFSQGYPARNSRKCRDSSAIALLVNGLRAKSASRRSCFGTWPNRLEPDGPRDREDAWRITSIIDAPALILPVASPVSVASRSR